MKLTRRQAVRGLSMLVGASILPATTSVAGPAQAASSVDLMTERLRAAEELGTARGLQVSIAYLDRRSRTGMLSGPGGQDALPAASVAKSFIADDLLFQGRQGEVEVTDDDRELLGLMLRNSDNDAAGTLWSKLGGGAVVERCVQRYELQSTVADDLWGGTMISARDMVSFYDGILSGRAGTAPADRDVIVAQLRKYNAPIQAFGFVTELTGEPVKGIKSGWTDAGFGYTMNSTAILGSSNRFVAAVLTQNPVDDKSGSTAALRAMIATMFPESVPQAY